MKRTEHTVSRSERTRLIKRVINPISYRDMGDKQLYARIIYDALRDLMFVGVQCDGAKSHTINMVLARDARFYLMHDNSAFDCTYIGIDRDGLVGHFLRLVGTPTIQSALDKFKPVN